MTQVLNIGLVTNDDIECLPTAALRALRAAGVHVEDWRHHVRMCEEPFMAVQCEATDHQVHLVATWLEQDCIAVWDLLHREGRLVGPGASRWGTFDPAKFTLLNGTRLSEARSVA